MAIRPLNRKAERLGERPVEDVRIYSTSDCCPGFLPGWEVGQSGLIDPCPWQADLADCHPCYWTAQVPDQTAYPEWLDRCANLSQDWQALCTVPD